MQKIGQYQIPSGFKRRPNIDRILFYHPFDARVQHDYISFLQTEREFEIRYRNRYNEISENNKNEKPKDKDWALSTHLYRVICERKSSSSHEDALKDYWFLCKLKEEYYELEKNKRIIKADSPRALPPILSHRSQASTPRDVFEPQPSPVIGKPPNTTKYAIEAEKDPPLFGQPHTVYVPNSPGQTEEKKYFSEPNVKLRRSSGSRLSDPEFHLDKYAFQNGDSSTRPASDRSHARHNTRTFESKILPHPIKNMFESDQVQAKPSIKVYPTYSKEDQKSMAAQNKHLRDLLLTQTDEISSLRNLDRENQDIIQNLKARLSSCTCDDNPESLEYTMNTSSTEIAQRFINLYDSEYKVAVDSLVTRHQDRLTEDVALYSMMEIIKRCYQLCVSVAEEQIQNMKSLLTDQVIQPCITQHSNVDRKVSANETTRLQNDAERLSKLYRRRHCTVTVANLTDKLTEELDKTTDYNTHLKSAEVTIFVEKCLQAIWFMTNQELPMTLEWPEQGEIFDTTLFKYFKGKGFRVNFPVWPAVLLHQKGVVLCKGFAIPM